MSNREKEKKKSFWDSLLNDKSTKQEQDKL